MAKLLTSMGWVASRFLWERVGDAKVAAGTRGDVRAAVRSLEGKNL